MIKGETKSGFKFEIDERATKDWKTIQCLRFITKNENALETIDAIGNLGEYLLGKNFDKLIKHIEKKNDGYCTIEEISNEIIEIFKSTELKN